MRRMEGTRTFPNPRWTLPGSDPTAELPAGAGGRIQEVGNAFKTLLWYQCKVIIFYLCHFGYFVFAPFHCKLQQFCLCRGQCIDIFPCQPENIWYRVYRIVLFVYFNFGPQELLLISAVSSKTLNWELNLCGFFNYLTLSFREGPGAIKLLLFVRSSLLSWFSLVISTFGGNKCLKKRSRLVFEVCPSSFELIY